MCAVFEIWPAISPGESALSAHALPPIPALLAVIRQIHHDSGQRYGSRVHGTLRTQGSGACRGRIERLMCRYGIRAIMAPLVGLADSRPNLPVPNLNARAFTAAAPGSPVSTTFQLRGWLYVAAIMASSAAK